MSSSQAIPTQATILVPQQPVAAVVVPPQVSTTTAARGALTPGTPISTPDGHGAVFYQGMEFQQVIIELPC